jgi:hypothetical protein
MTTGRWVILFILFASLGINALMFLLIAVNRRTLHRRWGESLPREDRSRWMWFRIRMEDKGWGIAGTLLLINVSFGLGILGLGGQ